MFEAYKNFGQSEHGGPIFSRLFFTSLPCEQNLDAAIQGHLGIIGFSLT